MSEEDFCRFMKQREDYGRTWNSPRSDDFDVGLEAVESKLETDLVVTLTGAAMRDKARE